MQRTGSVVWRVQKPCRRPVRPEMETVRRLGLPWLSGESKKLAQSPCQKRQGHFFFFGQPPEKKKKSEIPKKVGKKICLQASTGETNTALATGEHERRQTSGRSSTRPPRPRPTQDAIGRWDEAVTARGGRVIPSQPLRSGSALLEAR